MDDQKRRAYADASALAMATSIRIRNMLALVELANTGELTPDNPVGVYTTSWAVALNRKADDLQEKATELGVAAGLYHRGCE